MFILRRRIFNFKLSLITFFTQNRGALYQLTYYPRTPKFNLLPKFKPRIVCISGNKMRFSRNFKSNIHTPTYLLSKRKIIDFRLKSKTDSHFPKKEKIFKTYPMFSVNLVRVIGIQSHFWTGIFLFIQVLIILVSFKTGEHCTKTHVGRLIRAAECQTQLKVQAVGSSVSQSPNGTKFQ